MKSNIKKLMSSTFICLLLLSSYLMFAQNETLYFEHLTDINGLSSNKINSIAEDGEGFIWFATGDGINLYDGSSITKFNTQATSIISTSDTKMIFAGTSNGLEVFNRNAFSFNHFRLKNSKRVLLDSLNISTLFYKNKQLYIGGEYLYILNDLMTDFKKFDSPKDAEGKSIQITSINTVKKSYVLLGTQNGVWELNLETGKYTPIFKDKHVGAVYKLFVDSKKNLWVCTYSKGICFSKESNFNKDPIFYNKENGYLLNNRVIDIVEYEDERFFIANIEGGLVDFDKRKNEISQYIPDIYNPNSINGKALTALLKDSQDNIWIGTYNSGVNFIDNNRKEFEHYQINFKDDGLFNNNIRAIFQDSSGNIWIGTKEGGGLSKFNRDQGTFKHFKPDENNPSSISGDYILSIEELDSTHLIIGTLKNGIEILDTQTGKFSNYLFNEVNNIYNRSFVIHKDLNGRIWIDYGAAFYEFFPETKSLKKVEGITRVKSIIDEDKNHMWLGTYTAGLLLFNTKTEEFNKIKIDDRQINAIRKDKTGNLWIGTNNGLVCKKANSKQYVRYTVEEGLANNQISAILVDDHNNIWISTTHGLSKFDTKNQKFRNYDVNDGLQGNEFERYVALKTENGELMFGGRNGFNIFNPDNIVDNPIPPKVVITDFSLFNKPVVVAAENSPLKKHISQTKKLTLTHEQSVITFGFTALNYSSSEKSQYAYILEGFDKEWNYIGNKQEATYTNLPSGRYVFSVKASNSDGYWSDQEVSIEVVVLPPWWKTGYAYIGYFIVIVLLLSLFYHFSQTLFNLKNNLKLEQIEKEKDKEIYQAKFQFFTNISHEFRTPLTLLISPLDKLINSNITDPYLRKQFRLMDANAKRLLRLINELMDFRKVEKGQMTLKVSKYNIVDVTKKIYNSFSNMAEEKAIDYSFVSANDKIQVYFDLEKYDIILHNLLFNAFKFTPSHGNVKVEICLNTIENSQVVEIKVEDNGKGVSKEDLERIFDDFYQVEQGMHGTGIGLSLTKKLIELHNGYIKVESTLGKGSYFTVSLKLGKIHFRKEELFNVIENKSDANEKHLLEVLSKNVTLNEGTNVKNKKPKIKLLLVEDNNELRNYLKENLQDDYKVYEAINGAEGIEKCIKIFPDIVISDVMMPEKNGIEMCTDLKSDVRISHIPVILLTARTSFEHKIEGLNIGADAYIEKPFNMSLLEAQIINLLESRKKLRERFGNELSIQPHEISSTSVDDLFLNKAIQIIENHISNSEFNAGDFVSEIGMSRSGLHNKLKALTNKSTTEFIRSMRLKRAAHYLKETDQTVSEIAYKTGFSLPSYFSKCFKKEFGTSPRDYRG